MNVIERLHRRPASVAPDDARAGAAQARAWILLVGVLAVHVADEALTGFLAFYNPLVLSLRARLGWWPVPTFAFAPWFAGLVAAVAALALLTPAVRRGAPLTRLASYTLATIMFANGAAHLAGSVLYTRWLPGASSAPLLIGASVLLARRTRTRRSAAAASAR